MLDMRKPLTPSPFAGPAVAAAQVPEALREVFARLGRTAGRSAAATETRPDGDAETSPWTRPSSEQDAARARRANAHAAFLSAEGTPAQALNTALDVMEDEIARLRQVVVTYGETLKSLQVYAAEDFAREAARRALRAAPERLDMAAPVPRLPVGAAWRGEAHHG